jgi:hypothetical protein
MGFLLGMGWAFRLYAGEEVKGSAAFPGSGAKYRIMV